MTYIVSSGALNSTQSVRKSVPIFDSESQRRFSTLCVFSVTCSYPVSPVLKKSTDHQWRIQNFLNI